MHDYFTMVTVLSNSLEKENSFLRVSSQVDTFTQHSILPAAHKKVHSDICELCWTPVYFCGTYDLPSCLQWDLTVWHISQKEPIMAETLELKAPADIWLHVVLVLRGLEE